MVHGGGLTGEAVGVYRTMLRFPDVTEDDLASRLALTLDEVRRATAELEDRGFLAKREPDGERVLNDPDAAITAVVEEQVRRTASSLADLTSLIKLGPGLRRDKAVGQAKRLHGNVEYEVVRGAQAATEALLSLLTEAQWDYSHLINVSGRTTRLTHRIDNPVAESAQRRIKAAGGRLRQILSSDVRQSDEHLQGARSDIGIGVEIRLASGEMPPMMALFDDSVAMVPVDHEHTRAGAVIIRSPSLVASLRWLFESFWATCVPLESSDAARGGRKEQILDLLAGGAKDETIARVLGVGIRTIRREIAELMEELGAASRFQLGMAAATRRAVRSLPEQGLGSSGGG